jgi:hypothetical protein
MERFSADDWQIFLQALPKQLPLTECEWLDGTFALSTRGNAEILAGWLVIAVTSGFAPAYPAVERFVARFGRMKFLKPLFRALHGNSTTRELAHAWFAKNADAYHPIARTVIERLLAE